MNPNEHPDHCTRDGAERLAAAIVAYWDAEGYSIEATVMSVGRVCKDSRPYIHAVRTDMIDGMPVSMR